MIIEQFGFSRLLTTFFNKKIAVFLYFSSSFQSFLFEFPFRFFISAFVDFLLLYFLIIFVCIQQLINNRRRHSLSAPQSLRYFLILGIFHYDVNIDNVLKWIPNYFKRGKDRGKCKKRQILWSVNGLPQWTIHLS